MTDCPAHKIATAMDVAGQANAQGHADGTSILV
jgi:hypothetical protein